MQNRDNYFLNTIKFNFINPEQDRVKSKEYSDLLEHYAITIAWNLSLNLQIPLKRISVKLFCNRAGVSFGGKFTLEMAGMKKLDVESLNANHGSKLIEIIKKSIAEVDGADQLSAKDTHITEAVCSVCDAQQSQYKQKVAEYKYEYNSLNVTTQMVADFLDESSQYYLTDPPDWKMSYDRWNNLVGIQFEYKKHLSQSEEYLQALTQEMEAIIAKTPAWKPALDSVKARDFNQALRRACFAGALPLVQLLFKYDPQGQLNLDINSVSATTNLTAKDYAIASGNQALVLRLENTPAMTFNELRLAIGDYCRQQVQRDNPPRREVDHFGFMNPNASADSWFERAMADAERVTRENKTNNPSRGFW